jgi:NADPH:quinone reductase-like Zn-dependent oxidoreductase
MLALPIVKARGGEVAVVSSSPDKLDRVRGLGADFTASARSARWGEAVRRWSGGGVEAVLAIADDATLAEAMAATRDGGVIAILGVPSPGGQRVSFADVLMRRIRLQGIFVGSRADLARYLAFVEAHGIAPVIDRVFEGLASARDAFASLIAARHVGKLVIRVAA